MRHQTPATPGNPTRESRKLIRRVLDFDNMLESVGIDKESFYRCLDPETEFFKCFTFDLPVCLWAHDANQDVVFGNTFFTKTFGKTGRKCFDCIMAEGCTCKCCVSEKALQTKQPQNCKLCKRGNIGFEINVIHTPMTNQTGSRVVLKTSFFVKEPTAIFEQFYRKKQQKAAHQIFIVSCASCKRIKRNDGKWISIDSRVLQAFNGKISHGLCSECSKLLYPDLDFSLRSSTDLPWFD